MKVLKKAPGESWETIDIENDLGVLQEAVGGYIEAYTFCNDAAVICNEEGRLMDLPFNCWYLGMDWYGTILIVGITGEEFCGLTDEQIKFLVK